jgi:hypothetical protein
MLMDDSGSLVARLHLNGNVWIAMASQTFSVLEEIVFTSPQPQPHFPAPEPGRLYQPQPHFPAPEPGPPKPRPSPGLGAHSAAR